MPTVTHPLRQSRQVKESDTYDDTLGSGVTLETNADSLEYDLNGLRSQVAKLVAIMNQVPSDDWWNAPADPFGGGGTALDRLFDCGKNNLTGFTVPVTQNWKLLTVAAGEAPADVAAVLGTTEGAIVAQSALGGVAFDVHELIEVAGPDPISPLDIVMVRSATTLGPITSSGRIVFGLLQYESTGADNAAFNDVPSGNRVKISFVRWNATGTDLEACPVADIETQAIQYVYRARVKLLNKPEDCTLAFIRGVTDTGSASGTTVICRERIQGATGFTVGAGENWALLSAVGGETPSEPIAIAGGSQGAVSAQSGLSGGPFDSHELITVVGPDPTKPENLVVVREVTSRGFAKVGSDRRTVFGLLQVESTAGDGNPFNDVADRGKISLVRQNATGTALEAVPFADVENRQLVYAHTVRKSTTTMASDAIADHDVFEDGSTLEGATIALLDQLRMCWRRRTTAVTPTATVPGGQNWMILDGTTQAPADVGATTTTSLGATVGVSPFTGVPFDVHELTVQAGPYATQPFSLVEIRDASTGHAIFSEGHEVFGLLQAESTFVDGNNFDNLVGRAKISFVRHDSSLDNFEAVPVGDIENQGFDYRYGFRTTLELLGSDCAWEDVVFKEDGRQDIDQLEEDVNDLKTRLVHCWLSAALAGVTVPAAQNWQILNVAGGESPPEVGASGGGTEGAIVGVSAFSAGAFDVHELVFEAGPTALRPNSLVRVRNKADQTKVLSNDREVYALLQAESTFVDGAAFNDVSGGNRVKVSYVRPNATGTALEAAPVADVENLDLQYSYKGRREVLGTLGVPAECGVDANWSHVLPSSGGGGGSSLSLVEYAEATAEQDTTSTTYVSAATINISGLAAGTYMIFASCEITSSTVGITDSRVILNNPSGQVYGEVNLSITAAQSNLFANGVRVVGAQYVHPGGNFQLDVEWKSPLILITATIRNVYLSLWEVL